MHKMVVYSPTLCLAGIIFFDIHNCFESYWTTDHYDQVWGCILSCNSEDDLKEIISIQKYKVFKSK